MGKINRLFFFDHVRSHLFAGNLRQSQVNGLTAILDAWEKSHAAKDDRWLAYALGTTFHETAFTMKPIHEFGGAKYFFQRYDIDGKNPKLAKRLGNVNPGDGVLFHGRGYVQLTGRANYKAMGTKFGIDLTSSTAAADRALDPGLAGKIMFHGMENGVFTGKRFADFFAGQKADWRNARRIINGLDCADEIALYGQKFYAAISYTV